MQEIKCKKAKSEKKILGKDEIEIRKRSSKCDCGCACIGEGYDAADYDDSFDLAFDDPDPSCGCTCGSNVDLEQLLDGVMER